jgi:hypothetical protein
MFCFIKCKCLLFVYLYVVVIAAGLGVSALPRYGKQGCLGRIWGGAGSPRDAFYTKVWEVVFIPYPRMILPDIPVPVSMPPEREVLDARAAQKDEDVGYLRLSGRMSRIRDHVYVVMSGGLVP